eukprot:Skav207187  [mRNA]  locus=scaffold4046:25771:26775:+ [translate_table: standard]
MDFNHVEPKFRKTAWNVQMLLTSILILSALPSLSRIILSDEPPVDARVVPWNEGAGKWAICANKDSSQLIAAGVGLPSDYSQKPRQSSVQEDLPTEAVKREATMFPAADKTEKYDCAIFDLTKWKIPGEPYHFFLCGEVNNKKNKELHETHYFVWTDNKWSYIKHVNADWYVFYKLVRTRYGFDYGYKKDMYDAETLFLVNSMKDTRPTSWCGSMPIGKTKGQASVIEISIEDETILEYITLGTIPQLLKILSSLGGTLSVLSLVFYQIFPKKNKGSAISKEYEARTLRFAKGAKTEDELVATSATSATAIPDGNEEVRASLRPSKLPLPPQAP